MSDLKKSVIIMKKELRSLFFSPIAYIVATAFLFLMGFLFFIMFNFFYLNQADMRRFFELLPFVLTFVVPAITMRLFAEEKQSGSIEILMTMPLSAFQVVLGKFLASVIFVLFMLVPTFMYVISISMAGSPDFGPIIGGYLGVLFLSGAYVSIGLMISSITKNQIVAFIVALAVSLALFFIDEAAYYLPGSLGFVKYFGTDYHFENISRGVIDIRNIAYFISVITVCFLTTVRILEDRG